MRSKLPANLSITFSLLLGVCLATGRAGAADVAFASPPRAAVDGQNVKISFAVNVPTDVEVAIIDSQHKVVRHLAAGRLGEQAPAPFKKASLEQSLIWDRKDDAGASVVAGPAKIRVSIGLKPTREKYLGWDGATLGSSVVGLTVGAGGELYVMDSDRGWGRAGMRVFGPDGKYRRTIAPYPAATPRARALAVHALDVDGEIIPMVFSAHCGSLLPLFSGMKSQSMAWNPKGHLVLFSAVGTIAEHGPPRHLLAMHPQGGAPDGIPFVGPQIRPPIGFLGGAGERDTNFYDHLTVSPDGEFIYFTTYKLFDRKEHNAVFRVKWSDPEVGAAFVGKAGEAGADDTHLNNPQGLAVDKDGRLFVCDRGNNRVMVFDKDARPAGKFSVEFPYQVAIHSKTGNIYVLSRKRTEKKGDKIPPVRIARFPPWSDKSEMKEIARIEAGAADMALDPEAIPVRIWGGTGRGIVPIAEKDGQFEVGPPIDTDSGLKYPLFCSGDAARQRVLVREKSGGLAAVSMETGRIESLPIKGTDTALDAAGNIYVMDGYGANSLSRYTPDGKPLPFEAVGSNRMPTGVYRGYGPNMGLRGHCVRSNGEIYVVRSNNYGLEDGNACKVDVFGPDGKPRRTVVDGLGHGDCGLGVDAAGNVYVGVNLRTTEKPFPDAFMGRINATPYVWWRKGPRDVPWNYIYYNPYLYTWGSVLKFGPEGGKIWGNKPNGYKGTPAELSDPAKAPADAVSFKSAYLAMDLKVAGMEWRHEGYGPVPASDCNWGDPACVCMTGHLAADEYGRVFAPNPFRFSVEMLDSAGNPLARIGRYGNADDGLQGPAADIRFAWPTCASVSGGMLFVSDVVNRRIVVVRFDPTATADCPVP